MVERDRRGDALEDAGLAGLGRRDDQTALSASDRGDEVDGTPGDAIAVGRFALAGRQLEDQALGGIERRAELLQVLQDLEAAMPIALAVLASATRTSTAALAAALRPLLLHRPLRRSAGVRRTERVRCC